MNKRPVYKIRPKIKTLQKGQILRNKVPIDGTNAFVVSEDVSNPMLTLDDNHAVFGMGGGAGVISNNVGHPGSDTDNFIIDSGTSCLFIEDEQFMGSDGKTSTSAWFRWKIVAGDKVILFTLLRSPKKMWDYYTFAEKKKVVFDAIHETFEIIGDPT